MTPETPRHMIPGRKMVAWELALLFLVTGTILGLVASFVQRLWTKSDIEEAEERQAEQRKREEEREAIRKIRQMTMKPVFDFIQVAKQYAASEGMKETYKRTYQDNLGGVQGKMTQEQWLGAMNKKYPGPTMSDVVLAFSAAVATASTPEVQVALKSALVTLGPDQLAHRRSDAYSAIGAAEHVIEQYLVVV